MGSAVSRSAGVFTGEEQPYDLRIGRWEATTREVFDLQPDERWLRRNVGVDGRGAVEVDFDRPPARVRPSDMEPLTDVYRDAALLEALPGRCQLNSFPRLHLPAGELVPPRRIGRVVTASADENTASREDHGHCDDGRRRRLAHASGCLTSSRSRPGEPMML